MTLGSRCEADDALDAVVPAQLQDEPRMTSLRPGHRPPHVTMPARLFAGFEVDLAAGPARLEPPEFGDRGALPGD